MSLIKCPCLLDSLSCVDRTLSDWLHIILSVKRIICLFSHANFNQSSHNEVILYWHDLSWGFLPCRDIFFSNNKWILMFAANSAKSPQVFSGARSQVWSVCASATLWDAYILYAFLRRRGEQDERWKSLSEFTHSLTKEWSEAKASGWILSIIFQLRSLTTATKRITMMWKCLEWRRTLGNAVYHH